MHHPPAHAPSIIAAYDDINKHLSAPFNSQIFLIATRVKPGHVVCDIMLPLTGERH